jgi:hypothetical protein
MGDDINVHDQWAVESQGRIQDRTKEHLGSSDRAISAYRRLLKKSIDQVKKGERPILAVGAEEAERLRGPLTIDGISASSGVAAYAADTDRLRREGAPWPAIAAG